MFSLLRHQCPAAAHVLNQSVNLVLGTKSAWKINFVLRPGTGLQFGLDLSSGFDMRPVYNYEEDASIGKLLRSETRLLS